MVGINPFIKSLLASRNQLKGETCTLRLRGNETLEVHRVVSVGRKSCLSGGKAELIEMTNTTAARQRERYDETLGLQQPAIEYM